MASLDSQADSVLFAVPGEIREGIYSFYLAFDDADFQYSRLPSNTFLGNNPFSRPLPGLMTTCKRAYRELQAAVQETAILRAYRAQDRKRLGFAVHGTLRIPKLRKLVFQVMMEDAHWGWWLRFFAGVMEMAEELRELVVDWKLRKGQKPWNGGHGVAPSKQFMARLEEKAEARFFEAVAVGGATGKLQTVTVHGDVPAHWCEQLEHMLCGTTKVVVRKGPWSADEYGMVNVSSRGSTSTWNEGRAGGRSRTVVSRMTAMPEI